MITTPRSGPGREKARGAVLEVLERAAASGLRVEFAVWVRGVDVPVHLGGKGGYDPGRVLGGCRGELGDPFAWLATQLAGRLDQDPAAGGVDRVDLRLSP